ncbi:MAG: glutathione S-transferase family protein [Acinetobacter sp.]|nr:glutathione S-transferase family protein [Acinetobacter sp.]
MKLYYAPGTCALACWIALEWANADYDVIKVNPRSEEYLKINPLGMVPAVDIGTTRVMTQADAILQYICQRYPNSNLGANAGDINHFEFHETMCFLTGDFHPAFWPYFVPNRYTTDNSDTALDAVKQASYARVERVLAHLDHLIGDTGHVYQNKRSVADAYAFVMALWSDKMPKSWRDYANLAKFMQTMQQDRAVQNVLELSKAN